jgi:hypothetical protein
MLFFLDYISKIPDSKIPCLQLSKNLLRLSYDDPGYAIFTFLHSLILS